jgi:DNA-binding CsgD family transcriptional regulator
MLDVLGLDRISETVYLAMLAYPDEDVPELVKRLGVSEIDIQCAFDLLSELALIKPSTEGAGRLRAVSPNACMETLLARNQEELVAQQQRLEASRTAAARLVAECTKLRPPADEAGVEQLCGLDQIRDRLVTLTSQARDELMAFAPGGAQVDGNLQAARPLDEKLLRRGVRMRTVYLHSIRNSSATVAYAEWLAASGGQVRTASTLPTRMLIFDHATAVIPVSSDDTSTGAVLLTGEGTLTALCALFESVWVAARPLGQAPTPDAHGLTGQEKTTIRLLSEGHTDEFIAKRLGVSPRTARRIATDLMERLRARSRFEAGVRAVQAGWLA